MISNIFRKRPSNFMILGVIIISCIVFYTVSNYTRKALRTGPAGSYYVPGFIEPRRNICIGTDGDLKLLILVSSPLSNRVSRMAIRATWGRRSYNDSIAVAFFMGVCDMSDLNKSVQQEGDIYSDVIRASFTESYYNLTLKTMSMMQWASEYCSKAKFVLKVDDDMYINTPRLLKFVDEHYQENNAIFGRLLKTTEPVRNFFSKYYTSFEEFTPKYFPDFLTGGAYLLPGALVQPLYEKSLEMPFLKLEDAFMTGLVADALRINRVGVPEFSNLDVPTDACNVRRMISIHDVKPSELFDVWKKLFDPDLKCESAKLLF